MRETVGNYVLKSLGLLVVGVLLLSSCTVLQEPIVVTSEFEVFKPGEWIGREMPILAHIDIGEQLKEGNWLILLYHHDCSSCSEVIPEIEKMASEVMDNEDFLRLAVIEIPPHAQGGVLIDEDSGCVSGKMNTTKEWFVVTPSSLLLYNRLIIAGWENTAPSLDQIIRVFQEYCSDE